MKVNSESFSISTILWVCESHFHWQFLKSRVKILTLNTWSQMFHTISLSSLGPGLQWGARNYGAMFMVMWLYSWLPGSGENYSHSLCTDAKSFRWRSDRTPFVYISLHWLWRCIYLKFYIWLKCYNGFQGFIQVFWNIWGVTFFLCCWLKFKQDKVLKVIKDFSYKIVLCFPFFPQLWCGHPFTLLRHHNAVEKMASQWKELIRNIYKYS